MRALHFILSLMTALLFGSVRDEAVMSNETIEIRNDHMRIIVEKENSGSYRESVQAKKGEEWIEILRSGNDLRPEPALRRAGEPIVAGFQSASLFNPEKGGRGIVLEARGKSESVRKVITLGSEDYAHVQVTYSFEDTVTLNYLLSSYSFAPAGKKYAEYKPLDFVFTPMLRPEADDVIGDHTFRAPAFMMQEASLFAAVVPDIVSIDGSKRPVRAGADVRVDTTDMPMIAFGLLPWEKKGHVYYSHPESLSMTLPPGIVGYNYYVFVNASAESRKGFQRIVRFHWEKFGHQNLLQPKGPQTEPFASYIKKAWYQYVPDVAMDVEYEGKPVTLLRQYRLAWSNKLHKESNNDNWFNVWFNSLRTAFGMHLYGSEIGDEQLKMTAVRNLNLALLAPQKEGIAPSVFYHDSTGGHWIADHGWGGIREGSYYPMFHNAWTNYWLLEWSRLVPERRGEILRYARSFADFLLRNQLSSGVIPSWYDPETLEPAPEFKDENAETAGAAFFLAEFFRSTRESKYLEGAERAIAYVFDQILPDRKWFDFETFFSCSRKPLGFYDRHTGQHPQNTLSMHQAAEACYALYQLTGKQVYRERGIEVMDYLCLYQQVWSPRWLSCELLGGFGVQNTDGEWSDSRQGYFAVTLMNYYELTGRQEYFERGVAALRAMFSLFESPVSPRTAENYAHASVDQLAGVTGLHWGTGSSVVSIHLIRQRYGDAYINAGGQWGVGIDGCRISSVEVKGSIISVGVLDNVGVSRAIKMCIDKTTEEDHTLIVNGKTLGKFSKDQLRKGIDVTL